MSIQRRPGDAYVREEVMNLSPLGLVCRVLQGTTTAIAKAERHAAGENHAESRKEVTRARALINELRASLDHHQGGEISKQLEGLYEFISSCLLRPTGQADIGDLQEASRIVKAIQEGYDEIRNNQSATHA